MAETDQATVTLSKAEALVLFELCSRSDEAGWRLQDQAERAAVDALCCALESALVEPLQNGYRAMLAEAKRSLSQDKQDS